MGEEGLESGRSWDDRSLRLLSDPLLTSGQTKLLPSGVNDNTNPVNMGQRFKRRAKQDERSAEIAEMLLPSDVCHVVTFLFSGISIPHPKIPAWAGKKTPADHCILFYNVF